MFEKIYNYSVSDIGLNEKPKNKKVFGKITNTINNSSSTIDHFFDSITQPNSKSWSGGVFNGNISNSTWISQQVIGLDFDSGKHKVKEVYDFFENYGIKPNLFYFTFSHSEDHQRFRIVFFLDQPIIEKKILKSIFEVLNIVFDIDKKCFNAGRIFLGGTDGSVTNRNPISFNLFYDAIKKIGHDYFNDAGSGTNNKIISDSLYINYSSTDNNTITTTYSPRDQKIDWDKERSQVKVLDQLFTGERKLKHNEIFGLATNLYYIRKGLKTLKDLMKKFDQKNNENKYGEHEYNAIICAENMKYLPMAIKKFSKCPEDAEHGSLLDVMKRKGKIIQIDPLNKIPLIEAEKRFKEKFNYVMKNGNKKTIYIFRLPTAIGKTEILTNLEKTLIALPTNNLKNEVKERMVTNSVTTPDPISFLDSRLNNMIEGYYRIGLPQKAMKVIYDVSEGQGCESDIMAANNYIIQLNNCKDKNITTLTTHKRRINSDKLPHDTIIFDEDPLNTLVQVKKTTINDISGFRWQYDKIDEVTNYLENLEDGIYETPMFKMDLEDFINTVSSTLGTETNVFEFFNSSYFIYDKKKGEISYVVKNELAENKKVIIMSATIDPEIYKKLYPNYNFEVLDIRNVEQVGKVIQYTAISCSRNSLKNNINEVIKMVGEKKVITFMKYKNYFDNSVKDIHFGNCAGYDSLAGKDLAVIGTPHVDPKYYYLLGKLMKINFKYGDTPMNHQRVTHNGYEFTIKCFLNEELRKIQFSTIESELIQAVGRARTLRKDCTVELFSNYPLYITDEFHLRKLP